MSATDTAAGIAAALGSAPSGTMKLAGAWVVMLATPRGPGSDMLPTGFDPAWGGNAGIKVIAMNRDRLGEAFSALDLAKILMHPGPDPAPEWENGR